MATMREGLRRIARHAALSTLGTGYVLSGRYRSLSARHHVQILLLHHVPQEHLQRFGKLLKLLGRDGRFISYSQAIERIYSGQIDQPFLAVSFDDGFKSCLDAANVMSELGISACFFVNPYSIGLRDPQLIERFNRERLLGPPREFMTWDDLEELIERGHEVGSHTMTHPNLATLGQSEIIGELTESFATISARLGRADHFAWPYGSFVHFSAAAANTVFEAGYKSCASGVRGAHVSTESKLRDRNRICIRRDNCDTVWPIKHMQYFIAHNARYPVCGNTWPHEWASQIP